MTAALAALTARYGSHPNWASLLFPVAMGFFAMSVANLIYGMF